MGAADTLGGELFSRPDKACQPMEAVRKLGKNAAG